MLAIGVETFAKGSDKNLNEGLRILARIIARNSLPYQKKAAISIDAKGESNHERFKRNQRQIQV